MEIVLTRLEFLVIEVYIGSMPFGSGFRATKQTENYNQLITAITIIMADKNRANNCVARNQNQLLINYKSCRRILAFNNSCRINTRTITAIFANRKLWINFTLAIQRKDHHRDIRPPSTSFLLYSHKNTETPP
jgi:hypothetical protein